MGPPEPAPMTSARLKIYGDYFDRDTRAILALCDMAEVEIELVYVDTFNGGNLEETYKKVNPAATIPTLTQGLNMKATREGNLSFY